jgi:hypothetical protein
MNRHGIMLELLSGICKAFEMNVMYVSAIAEKIAIPASRVEGSP